MQFVIEEKQQQQQPTETTYFNWLYLKYGQAAAVNNPFNSIQRKLWKSEFDRTMHPLTTLNCTHAKKKRIKNEIAADWLWFVL